MISGVLQFLMEVGVFLSPGFFSDLKILGKAISVVLLVEPLGIHGSSHLQHLEVSFQLLGHLGGFHVKPSIPC